MRKANITYEPQGLTGFIVTLSFDEDSSITLSGQADGPDPTIVGTSQFTRNPALVDNLWAYATQEHLARRSRSQEKRKGHSELARHHGDLSRYIAKLIQVGIDSKADRLEWCSGCLGFEWHRRVADKTLIPLAFLCQKCGSPTSVCFAPNARTWLCGDQAASGYLATAQNTVTKSRALPSCHNPSKALMGTRTG